jgi:nucleoporin POM34
MSSSALAQVQSTPVKQTAAPPVTESPGNWKHPRLAEITRRQSRNTFSEKNIRHIVYNVAALVGLGLAQQVVLPIVPSWA